MKKLLVGLLSIFILGGVLADTDDVDHFVVKLSPNPIKVNQVGDLMIEAVDAEGNIVEDYIGEVYIEVPELESSDYTVPGDNFYSFETDDQGEVTLSKGTEFTKAGTYELVVYDLFEDSKRGIVEVIVQPDGAGPIEGYIEVVSPIAGSTEKTDILSILGKSDKPNSPIEIFIDGKLVEEDLTDGNGDFNVSITNIEQGEHNLEVKLMKIDGEVVTESGQIAFKYEVADTEFFKSLSIEPSNTVSQNDNVYIRVNTVDRAASVKLKLEGIGEYLMENVGDGEFTKNLAMNLPGTFDISLIVTVGDQEKEYTSVDKIKVVQGGGILTSKVVRLEESGDKANITWEYEGSIEMFKVIYGLTQTELDNRVEVATGAVELIELDPVSDYYYQILPLNANGDVDGEPSKVELMKKVNVGSADKKACVIKGIKIQTKKIGDKNYLVWDKVDGATKYIVYKSEENVVGLDKMQKVLETIDTKYEYPFDNASEEDIYNYYGVEAECENGTKVQVDSIKKIQVGPLDSLLLMLLISIIAYLGFKLYRYSD